MHNDIIANNLYAVRPSIQISIKRDESEVPKGRDVRLRCQVTLGYPKPSIEWKKDAKRLPSKQVSSTEADLELNNIQPVDAGRYVCTAKNIAGFTSRDVVITVKCKFSHKTEQRRHW